MVEKKAARAKSVDKWKRKKWFTILAPRLFNGREIGETPALKEKQVIGRTLVLTLDKLTGNRTQRHIDVVFGIVNVSGLKAGTEIKGHEIKHSYLNRIVRRRRSKMDVTVSTTTKDGKKIRISAMTLSARKIERNKEKMIRKLMLEEVTKTASKNSIDTLMEEVLSASLSSRIFKKARAIAPLKRVEIVKSKILK